MAYRLYIHIYIYKYHKNYIRFKYSMVIKEICYAYKKKRCKYLKEMLIIIIIIKDRHLCMKIIEKKN